MERQYIFPENFLWGSATSAFQVEGECVCHDFYDWAEQGKIKDGTNPADAVFFWKYYKKDIGLMKKMNHNAARIGLEWARIESEKGKFVEEALEGYRAMLAEMRETGISPMVTIHHFSNPLWLTEMGGWNSSEVVSLFRRFTERVVRYLGDLVDVWITINEPSVYAFFAYFYGEFPPGKKNLFSALRVLKNMARSHCSAYEAICEIYWQKKWGQPKVGVAKHLRTFDPSREGNPFDRFSARLMDSFFNNRFLSLINRKNPAMNVLGINYYSGDLVRFPLKMLGRDELPKNKLGWDIYPEGFFRVLKRYYSMYRMPIYITENGTCDDNDELRPRYILDHVYQMHRALSGGVDIAGYYHWSTLDNFELVDGLTSRFGLVHVDHEHPERKRTIKQSGMMYGEIAEANGITDSIVKKYVPDWSE